MAKNETPLNKDPRAPVTVDDPLAVEIRERDKVANNHYKDWDGEAKEDYKFGLGDQWTEEDRQALKEAGRPCLTFNRIRSLVNIISGYQRENSARIKVNPEGGEDRIFSEVMDRGIKAVDKWSHLSYKMGYWFDDGCYCGKGWLEAVMKYDRDPIRGELDFKQRSPYQIRVDPECCEYDINESAGWVIKTVRLTKENLKSLYPKKAKWIDGFVKDLDDPVLNGAGVLSEAEGSPTDDDYGNSPAMSSTKVSADSTESDLPQDGKFTVKEYWRPKMIQKFFVINKESGDPKKFDDEASAQAFATEQGEQFKVIKRSVKEMWVAAMVCGYVMQDDKSPFEPYYSGYPFFRFLADWAPNADSEVLRTQGMVRPLKDPQREKNKSKSSYLHILSTQSNSGWVGDEDALTPDGWKALEALGSKPGITIKKKTGKELREIQPKGVSQGQLVREEKAEQEFTLISGINPDLLGFQDQTQSGKAISLRMKQAVLALVRLFSNYRYSKEIIGKFILDMMPLLFDSKKLSRVLGPDYMAKAVDPQKYPNGLQIGNLDAFLHMVADERYDVAVTEADQNATVRYEIFQEMTELLKAGAPIPITLLVDYMDLPNAEEVKQEIMKQQQAQQQMALEASAKK